MLNLREKVLLLGRNTVLDTLKSDKIIVELLISAGVEPDDKVKEIVALAQKKAIPWKTLRVNKFAYFDERGSSQGVVALMQMPQNPTIEQILETKENPIILLFNHLDYEQNLGSILRSSWAADVDLVVCAPNGVHEITPVVSKVSMGGAAYVPVIGKSLHQVIAVLKKRSVPIVGVEANMGTNFAQTNLTGPIAFLFGGEAVGLSDPLMKACDIFVNIPMAKGVASLNVAVATALIIFEKNRQENLSKR